LGHGDDVADTSHSDAPSRWNRFKESVGAWQPLTGAGVAAFARSSLGRVMLFQLLVALASAGAILVSLRLTLFPVVEASLRSLPESVILRQGTLSWTETHPQRLGENPWFDFVLTPIGATPPGQTADLQWEFRSGGLRCNGVFGHVDLPWPQSWVGDFGRVPASAAWGAWRAPGQALLGFLVVVGLCLAWWVMATGMTLPAWLAALALGRSPGWGGIWRMASAALLTGAGVALLGLAGYITGYWRLPGLLVSQVVHLLVGWIWLGWGVSALPQGSGNTPAQPFRSSSPPRAKGAKSRKNPFGQGSR
jgi:hypothetical protein